MDPSGSLWAVYLVLAVVPLLLAVFVAALLWSMRRKPAAGLGPRVALDSNGTHRLLGGSWNAMVSADSFVGAMGGTVGATFGRLELDAGTLRFLPDGSTTAAWSVSAQELGVGRGMARPVRLESPMGTLHLTASREHINRWTRNSLKTLREQRYADELVQALVAWGARRV